MSSRWQPRTGSRGCARSSRSASPISRASKTFGTADDRRWTILGAPLDSSGANRGEANAPRALRAAGVVERVDAADAGDVSARIETSRRDPGTGLIGYADVCAASAELRERVGELLNARRRPLVIGGDCTLLIGVFAALQDRSRRPALWFVDGHLDYYDGDMSPTGETADMDLAILTGHGPPGLVDIAGQTPLLKPADAIVLGHRAGGDAEGPEELEMVHAAIELVDAPTVRARGPERVGGEAATRLAAAVDLAWLHLDLDVLSTDSLAAVSYRQSGGLSWEELATLLRPLVASDKLAGISVADLNADLDPEGSAAEQVCELLVELLKEN